MPADASRYALNRLGVRLVGGYLAVVIGWYLFLRARAAYNHEPHWVPSVLRNYPVSTALAEQGRAWFHARVATSHNIHKAGPDPSLCVVIDTYHRRIDGKPYDYFPETIGTLLEPLTVEERRDVFLVVHVKENVEPGRLVEARFLADVLSGPGAGDEGDSTRQGSEASIGPIRQTQAEAFRTCLDSSSAQHIIYLEDDVVARPSWHRVLQSQIMPALTAYPQPWLGVFLFHSDDLRGWTATQLKTTGAVLAGSYALVAFALHLQLRLRPAPALALPILLAPLIAFFLIQGRHAAFPLPSGFSNFPEACCAQALLFSRRAATELVAYSLDPSQEDRLPRDLSLRRYAARHALDMPVWRQSLWQHVGTMSGSRRMRLEHFVRNWGFEVEGREW